ncbi:hypothetical protein MMC25_007142 [Agyrium rufum]|nr:hypothetical protein [Agyrium rufum]
MDYPPEKVLEDGPTFSRQAPRSKRSSNPKLVIVLTICACLFLIKGYVASGRERLYALYVDEPLSSEALNLAPSESSTADFSWSSITPSKHLDYHDCYEGFKCARLEVPLDWNSTEEDGGAKAALAVIKLPAVVSVIDPRYGGVILHNPGGPGGSGVNFLRGRSSMLRSVVDAPAEYASSPDVKFFDLLSWDPRGIGNTTPKFQCFDDEVTQRAWSVQSEALGLDLQDPVIFASTFARERALGEVCVQNGGSGKADSANGKPVAPYVSTPVVVRDMVEIIERHAEWREQQAVAELGARDDEFAKAISARLAWSKGEEKLQYWGFSYGTILGQYFATLQPHRVHRVVVDGVADVMDYSQLGWSQNLWDIDAITSGFAVQCYEAGPAKCSAYAPEGAAKILQNLADLLVSLEKLPVIAVTEHGPSIVTKSILLTFIFNAWYSPMRSFEATAVIISDLMKGNGSILADAQEPTYSQFCGTGGDYDPLHSKLLGDAGLAIRCTDGPDMSDKTVDDWNEYISYLNNQSTTFGNRWAVIPLGCYSFSVPAKWRFPGPFGAKTAHPMLFASQTLDPVTSLRNAVHASEELFPGSSVLEVQGMGHCTLAMPSTCSAKIIRNFFQTGLLPEGRTVCPVDVLPFQQESEIASMLEGEDGSLLRSLVDVAKDWRVPGSENHFM